MAVTLAAPVLLSSAISKPASRNFWPMPGVILGIGFEDQAGDRRCIERSDPAALAEHRVGNQEMRVQVGVAGRRLFLLQLHDLAIADTDHDAARSVVGELQPRDMARLGAILAVLPDASLPDVLGDSGHRLARCFEMRIEDLRLLDRIGESPGDRDRLVGCRAEVIGADRVTEVALAGLRIDRQSAHRRIVLARRSARRPRAGRRAAH